MVVRTLDVKKDPFGPPNGDEEILDPDLPYLCVIRALLFLGSHTRPDISFSFKLLARYSSCPTRRHWNEVKQIFCYLQGDRTKHNLPKYFFTHDLQKSGDIVVQKVRSSDNLSDLFTKALSAATLKKLVHDIEMQRVNELK
ncbi:hypothetical protein Tco_1085033 [Tanacetum coccineum]